MEAMSGPRMRSLDDVVVTGRTVILRPDINSPIDIQTRKIINTNRLEKAIPTLKYLLDHGAKVAIIAHQGDTMDYQNLIPMAEHAEILSTLSGYRVEYIDDVCGPAAQDRIKALKEGEAILLGNLRYLGEELTAFEKEVKLTPKEMLDTWLVRSLAPLADLYVNDAFAAAHRSAPSMVAFQEVMETVGGRQLFGEYEALSKIASAPIHPCVFFLGGGKISDAFSMMRNVLTTGKADRILTGGITADVMLLASGVELGVRTRTFLAERDLTGFIAQAKELLQTWPDRFLLPVDCAYERDGERAEATTDEIARAAELQQHLFVDLGEQTIASYVREIERAGSVFVNGPAGIYEDPRFERGTEKIWQAIASAPGYTVVGGGDTITAAKRFTNLDDFSYVCTAGGAMIRFLSGKKMPLIEAMERAWERDRAQKEKQ